MFIRASCFHAIIPNTAFERKNEDIGLFKGLEPLQNNTERCECRSQKLEDIYKFAV